MTAAGPRSATQVPRDAEAIDATGLTALPLGTSSDLRVGDIVFAIGDPFGVGETVTMGIISAKNRANVSIEGPNSIQDFIQTDAAINPGNSGGALINTKGQVIGINTAIVSGGQQGGNIGIGFAIPINLAKSVMEQIVAHGNCQCVGGWPLDKSPFALYPPYNPAI